MSWKFLVPLTLVNIAVAALWHWTGDYNSIPALALRWGVGAVFIAIPFYGLARILNGGKVAPRTYRYAE
jgi:hypothetical protein